MSNQEQLFLFDDPWQASCRYLTSSHKNPQCFYPLQPMKMGPFLLSYGCVDKEPSLSNSST